MDDRDPLDDYVEDYVEDYGGQPDYRSTPDEPQVALPDHLRERIERARAAAERSHGKDPARGASICPDCGDHRWVTRGDSTQRPCSRCNPVSYRRWVEGHYAQGHGDCEECKMMRRGDISVGRDVDPVTGDLRPGVLRDL